MILLRKAEHHCSVLLSGWQYFSSFKVGCVLFQAKLEVLINFPGNQMLLVDKYARHSFTRPLCYKGMSCSGKFAAGLI